MAIGEPSGAPAHPRADEQEPIYEGEPGRTHLKSIQVPLPNGFVRTLQVYDVVNVGTDPHLRDPTLAGALHRFETGEVLAIPFVFHDPHARKLALVVPEVLRHEELSLRAKLLSTLAEHPEAPVPAYVSEARTVVGVTGLAAYLEAAPTAQAGELAQREAQLTQRETQMTQREAQLETRGQDLEVQTDALAQREGRLKQRAEQVTRREDELREFSEELEAARADLAMREQELESRLEMLVQRESELAQQRSGSISVGAEDVVELADESDVEPVEEIEELEPLETSPGEIPEDLSAAVKMVADGSSPIDPAEDVEEIVEDVEELEEVEPLPDEVTGVHADASTDEHELKESKTVISSDVGLPANEVPPPPARPASVPPPPPKSAPPAGPQPSVPPPPGFLQSRLGANAVAILHDGGVRIFGRIPEAREEDLFTERTPELLAQLVVVEECPVVLLSVVEQTDGRPEVLRAPIDPRGPQREILEQLQKRFAAKVELFSLDGRYLRGLEVEGPRETNVKRVLERVSKMRTAAAVDVATGIDRVLSAPPPVKAKDSPFSDEPVAEDATAGDVLEALQALSKWGSHDKLDHARLVLSIPSETVEATLRDVIDCSLANGLALPDFLAKRAVALGIADDEATLVAGQLERFRELCATDDHGGLNDEQIAENWEYLLKAAADNEVALDTDTHEVAWNIIRKVRGDDDGPSKVDPDKLPELGIPQLVMLLEHPRYRRDAAIELAKRKDADLADKLCKAVRKMPRSEVVRVVPQIVQIGDSVGDALIDGLGARKTFVRQAFALGLGHLKLRRSVVPLVHLLASEQSEVWREIARVVGSFGTASLRTVTRQLKDPKGLEERYVLTLAHLANNGCRKQVDKLTKDDKPAVATMATEALAMRAEAESRDEALRGEGDPPADDPIGEFSHRFYAELEGRSDASESDPSSPNS